MKNKLSKANFWDRLDEEAKSDALEAIKELDNEGGKPHSEATQNWKDILTPRALKSEDDIANGRVYKLKEAKAKHK